MTEAQQQKLIKKIISLCGKVKHLQMKQDVYFILDMAEFADAIAAYYDRENKKAS